MLEAPHYSAAGARLTAPFALPADLFDGTVHEPVLHQAVRAFLNNQRQGTHATKTRRWVAGGNQKPWRQKGTGRARQGTIRAPHWRGGGIVFGPQPRDYETTVPRKVKLLARKSALNARAREGALAVIEQVGLAQPKTSALLGLIARLGFDGGKTLVLTHGANTAAWKSGRNVPTVHVMPYAEASAYDILWADAVIVEQQALGAPAPEGAAEAPAPKAAKAAKTAKKAAAPKAAKAVKKAVKTAATKKASTKAAKTAAPKAAKKKGGK